MKKIKQVILLIMIGVLITMLISGCSNIIPDIPGPDQNYDEENTQLAYFKVLPTKIEMRVNQSQKFEVKGYNSDDKQIAIDLSQLEWVGKYQCYSCGKVWKLMPVKNSIQTTFTPWATGTYEIWIKYKGKFEKKADVLVK